MEKVKPTVKDSRSPENGTTPTTRTNHYLAKRMVARLHRLVEVYGNTTLGMLVPGFAMPKHLKDVVSHPVFLGHVPAANTVTGSALKWKKLLLDDLQGPVNLARVHRHSCPRIELENPPDFIKLAAANP
jgi:hypothetical protein